MFGQSWISSKKLCVCHADGLSTPASKIPGGLSLQSMGPIWSLSLSISPLDWVSLLIHSVVRSLRQQQQQPAENYGRTSSMNDGNNDYHVEWSSWMKEEPLESLLMLFCSMDMKRAVADADSDGLIRALLLLHNQLWREGSFSPFRLIFQDYSRFCWR